MTDTDPVVQHGNPVLRQTAREVALDLIGGATINQEIQQMKDVLLREYEGVALAAPQIGISRRMFIVSARAFADDPNATDMVFINPTYLKTSQKTKPMDEGCLSVRDQYGQVKRHTNVTISYYDEHGTHHTRGAGGLLAHIIQHEMDHLDGVLFIDKAEQLETLSGADKREFERQKARYLEQLDNND